MEMNAQIRRIALVAGLLLVPSLAPAAVVGFTPSGTSTVSQATDLYWDLQSSATSTTTLGAPCDFYLSDHGDFHWNGDGSMVVLPNGEGGDTLASGTLIGPGSNWSTMSYAGTTGYQGEMVPPQTAYFGLRCAIGGQTYYGWVQIEEGTTDQSVLAWALETTPNAPIAAGATSSSAPTPVPTLSEWGIIILSSLLAVGTLLTLRRQRQ